MFTMHYQLVRYQCLQTERGNGNVVLGNFTMQDGRMKKKQHHRGATTRNLSPEEIRGQLDEDVLTTLELTDHLMKTCDALFFFLVL